MSRIPKEPVKLVTVPSPNKIPERDIDKSPILECQHLGIDFGGLSAVKDFNMAIGRTEIAGLIGPNGAGKTTVFNLLTKVYQPTRGTILLDGVDTHNMNTVQVNKAGIARTFQNIRLFNNLTVEDNVKLGLHNHIGYGFWSGIFRLPGYWKEEKVSHERAMELLSIFDMGYLAKYKAGSLPYGAQRKLEIVRALATNPSLLLLDEPAAGMNPSGYRGAQLRPDHRQGHPRRDQERPGGHRGLSGQEKGGVTMETEALLKVEGINVYYGAIHAIKDISFQVNAGEIVTLIGANGAGKTTTLQTISGLLRSKTGSITFEGHSISNVRADKLVAHGLAQVPEGRRVFLQMSVEENLEMGAYTQPPSGVDRDLEMVYDLFPRLRERRRQVAGTLSGGEQQMLAMGRALMSHPKLLMLDEPSMGLAPILVEQIFEIIRNLNHNGSTILLVEQNAQMALSVAHRGYVLETGKIVATGTGEELINSPDIKKAYLGG